MASETITKNDLQAILNEVLPSKIYVDMTTPYLALDTTATSGNDKDIYDALVSLSWDSDVIV